MMINKNRMRVIVLHLFILLMLAVLPAVCFAESNSATSSTRPNILFCIADDASYPHMGAYGCNWVKTPGFDRVAKQGLLFTKAYTPNAKCAPSRACILTGRNSWQLKQACNHWCFFPKQFTTYAEALTKHGYYVGTTGKGWAPGIAVNEQGKRRAMTGKAFGRARKKPPTTGISGIDYAGNFQDFMNAKTEDTPWCFWYGGGEPHRGYEYGSGVKKGGKSIDQIDVVPPFWPDNEITRNDMLDYAFEVEHFDSHLLQMLNLLESRGELDNTLVVVTSDNGMPFPRIKGQEYELSNHLPLAIMWKKGIAKPGRTIDDYVSFIDFAPTFLELAQLNAKRAGMEPTTGRSLVEIFRSKKTGRVIPQREFVLIGKERHDIGRPNDWGYPIRGIVKNGMLYLINYETSRWPGGNPETGYLNCDGSPTKTEILNGRTQAGLSQFWQLCFGKRPSEELYDVINDPYCMNNLANSSDYQKQVSELKSLMIANLKRQNDPRVLSHGDVFENYPYANTKEQDYYNRYMKGEKIPAGWVNPSDYAEKPLD